MNGMTPTNKLTPMEEAYLAVQEGKKTDKVDPKQAKKDFDDRDDKDIDNDGDVDSSDKFLHKRRKAIAKKDELDEAFKKGDVVKVNTGPHKHLKHEVIHAFDDGTYNIKPYDLAPSKNRYPGGAVKVKSNQIKTFGEAIAKKDDSDVEENYTDKQDASYTDRYSTGGKDTADMQKRRKAAIKKAADRFKKTGSYTGKADEKGKKRPDPLRNTKPLKFESVNEEVSERDIKSLEAALDKLEGVFKLVNRIAARSNDPSVKSAIKHLNKASGELEDALMHASDY